MESGANPVIFDSFGRPANLIPQTKRKGVASGVGLVGGFFKPIQLQEPPELATSRLRHETLRVMSQTDSYIAESLRIVTLPLLCQATWQVKPAIDVEDGATLTPEQQKSKDLAEMIGCNLFGQQTEKYGTEYIQQSTFSQFIRELLTSLPHGFALFHKTAKAVNGDLVYDRLHWLEPSSIYRWDVDGNDELRGVTRNYVRPDNTPITGEYLPVDELFIIVWEGVGARYEGVPFIRSQFGPWKRKEFIQRCKMIAVQQASVGQPYAVYDANEFGGTGDVETNEARIEEFLQSSFGSGLGTAYLTVPNKTFKAEYLRLDAAALEAFDKLSTHENLGEAHGGSTKSMMLGEMAGGSRATAQSQRSTESVVAIALAQIAAQQIQRGFNNCKGLIEELTDWKVGKGGVSKLPYVLVEGVDPDNAARNGKAIAAYATAGLVKYRPSLEQKLLQGSEITLADDEFDTDLHPELLIPTVPPPFGPNNTDPVNGKSAPGTQIKGPKAGSVKTAGGGQSNSSGVAASDIKSARRISLRLGVERMMRMPIESQDEARAQGYGRSPSLFESKVCALGAISGTLTTAGEQIGSALRRASASMIEDLIKRIDAGKITRASLVALRRTRPKNESALVAPVRERFAAVAALGRRHANEELARQAALASEVTSGSIAASSLMLADGMSIPPSDGPGMLPAGAKVPVDTAPASWIDIQDSINELAVEERIGSEIAIDEVWTRLLAELIAEFNAAVRSGLSDSDAMKHVESAMSGLSGAKNDLAGRQLAEVAYNLGRDVAAKEASIAGEAQWVVRTEVLDSRTCRSCAGLDGVYLKIASPEYEQYLPPAMCDGGDNCRGFVAIISNDLAKALDDALGVY